MKRTPHFRPMPHRKEVRGFVLITALIFLVVLSGLTLMALKKSLFEERMSGNDRDTYFAREAAELALRDAERDIAGLRFDGNGNYCATAAVGPTCGGNIRPVGNRPASVADANFWIMGNSQYPSIGLTTVSNANRPATGSLGENGVYTNAATAACGRSLWLAADWDGNTPASGRLCADDSSIVRTTIYGEFTGAPTNTFGAGVRLPRYLIEILDASDMGITTSSKVFFRITAVGFGRLRNDNGGGLTSVTLQSIFSPL